MVWFARVRRARRDGLFVCGVLLVGGASAGLQGDGAIRKSGVSTWTDKRVDR